MRRPWFVGGSDLDILGKIFQAFGTPSEAQWPGMKDLPNFVEFQKTEPPPLASIVKGVSMQGLFPNTQLAATHNSAYEWLNIKATAVICKIDILHSSGLDVIK